MELHQWLVAKGQDERHRMPLALSFDQVDYFSSHSSTFQPTIAWSAGW